MFELLHVGLLLYGYLRWGSESYRFTQAKSDSFDRCILVYAVKSTKPVLTYDIHLYESLSHQYLLIQQLSERMPLPQPHPIKKKGGGMTFISNK